MQMRAILPKACIVLLFMVAWFSWVIIFFANELPFFTQLKEAVIQISNTVHGTPMLSYASLLFRAKYIWSNALLVMVAIFTLGYLLSLSRPYKVVAIASAWIVSLIAYTQFIYLLLEAYIRPTTHAYARTLSTISMARPDGMIAEAREFIFFGLAIDHMIAISLALTALILVPSFGLALTMNKVQRMNRKRLQGSIN